MYSIITNPNNSKEAPLDSKEGLEILKKICFFFGWWDETHISHRKSNTSAIT